MEKKQKEIETKKLKDMEKEEKDMEKKQNFQLYNSMKKEKEIFKPRVADKVGMYVCGVTTYDLSHIGHARAYVSFDVLYRYLKHLGYEVTYVRNFTDVDDKIIDRANEKGENPLELSHRFCDEFLKDMADLQCLPPTHQPRVSDHMDQIKNMIDQIISKGSAYPIDGDVYFSIKSFPHYGRLSGRKVEDNRAGERVAVDPKKKNPADFALWKAAKAGEPSWESPWGSGRPGWHIECSAMSTEYLSHSFDIHGGGQDLIFPHHENEIAQSCAACSESKVTYWLHNGFVTTDTQKKDDRKMSKSLGNFSTISETGNEETLSNQLSEPETVKMSKSLGNFFTIREVTKLYHPLALRYFLMGTQYRSPVNFSLAQLDIASEAVFYIFQTLQDCEDALSKVAVETEAQIPKAAQDCINKLWGDFEAKMNDDLSTPAILTGALQEALRFLNNSLNQLKKNLQQKQLLQIIRSLKDVQREFTRVLDVLGLLPPLTYSQVLDELKVKALKRAEVREEEILKLMEERVTARKNKMFSRGDEIRAELAAKGIALMDIGSETVWRPCVPVKDTLYTFTPV